MSDQSTGNGSNPLNSTLHRLDLTLEQQTATAVSGLHLPTFSGKANEDVFDFLNKFKLPRSPYQTRIDA